MTGSSHRTELEDRSLLGSERGEEHRAHLAAPEWPHDGVRSDALLARHRREIWPGTPGTATLIAI